MRSFLLALCVFMVPVVVLGQVPPVSGIGFLDAIVAFLAGLDAGIIATVLAFIELLMRVVPTQAPMSLLVIVKKVLDVGIWILGWVSEFFGKVVAIGNRLKK